MCRQLGDLRQDHPAAFLWYEPQAGPLAARLIMTPRMCGPLPGSPLLVELMFDTGSQLQPRLSGDKTIL